MCEYKQGYRWVETYLWFGWQCQQHSGYTNLYVILKATWHSVTRRYFTRTRCSWEWDCPKSGRLDLWRRNFREFLHWHWTWWRYLLINLNTVHYKFLCVRRSECWIYIRLCLGFCVSYFPTLLAHHEKRDLSEFLAISAKLAIMAMLALKFLHQQKKLPPLGLDLMITWSIVWCLPYLASLALLVSLKL